MELELIGVCIFDYFDHKKEVSKHKSPTYDDLVELQSGQSPVTVCHLLAGGGSCFHYVYNLRKNIFSNTEPLQDEQVWLLWTTFERTWLLLLWVVDVEFSLISRSLMWTVGGTSP